MVYSTPIVLSEGTDCTLTSTCSSSNCIDQVCCDTECGGGIANDCQACSVATGASEDGTCTLLTGTTCDDDNECTHVDTCQSGTCEGTDPVTCTALDQCHQVGTCNPDTAVCSNPIKDNGSDCDDDNECTQLDTCQSGACEGAGPVTCSALDECHVAGTCAPETGECSNPIKDNGEACPGGTCQGGVCIPGPEAGPDAEDDAGPEADEAGPDVEEAGPDAEEASPDAGEDSPDTEQDAPVDSTPPDSMTADAATPSSPGGTSDDSGCGCRVASPRNSGYGLALLALLAGLIGWRRLPRP